MAAELLPPLRLTHPPRKFRWTAMLWTNPVVVVIAMAHGLMANVKRLANRSSTHTCSPNHTLTF